MTPAGRTSRAVRSAGVHVVEMIRRYTGRITAASRGSGYGNVRFAPLVRGSEMGYDPHNASLRGAGMVVAMIEQLGDHFAPGTAGFTRRTVLREGARPPIEIILQAARTRAPTAIDAVAAIILAGQRATHEAAYSFVIERAHRYDWPILIAAMEGDGSTRARERWAEIMGR